MRITRIVLAVALAAFAVASWAKHDVVSRPKLTFAERWAPVDEAFSSSGYLQQ
jgi:hypothetical protein